MGKDIYVASNNVKGGRGVYCNVFSFLPGAILEVCPTLLIKNKAVPEDLDEHVYVWDRKLCALALGYGSLYNHSYTPNAKYKRRVQSKEIVIVAIKTIFFDEEITINYNYHPDDKTPMWFKVK